MSIKLYVGNVSYRATDDDLLKKFSETGKCLSAKIVLDTFSGQSKGFAFVEMATDADAKEAIRLLNRTAIYGRGIIVSEAQPPRPRERRGNGEAAVFTASMFVENRCNACVPGTRGNRIKKADPRGRLFCFSVMSQPFFFIKCSMKSVRALTPGTGMAL